MKIVRSIAEWKLIRTGLKGSLGFVPTMGALHEGHLTLIKRAKSENELVAVSIFVNPTQFNDPKDLKNYPRPMDEDQKKLESLGVDYLFSPEFSELYPDNYRYMITEKEFSLDLCGASRPGHFDGVLSVVMKLFNVIDPDKAYFGEKDYQQLELIKGMVEAFFMRVKVIPCTTVRESDGLAMSSRNLLLTPEGRKLAPLFHQELSSSSSVEEVKANLEKAGFRIDYIEEKRGRRFGAVFLDNVRLIDNVAR